ncbi:hypothetical protein AB1N83_006024 [Pleurotus pulmonarius]
MFTLGRPLCPPPKTIHAAIRQRRDAKYVHLLVSGLRMEYEAQTKPNNTSDVDSPLNPTVHWTDNELCYNNPREPAQVLPVRFTPPKTAGSLEDTHEPSLLSSYLVKWELRLLHDIEIAHVLPKSKTTHDLRFLQKTWHMKCSLNIDSPLNLMYLRADWHRSFNRGHWVLLPAPDLLARIFGEVLVNEDEDDLDKADIFAMFLSPPKNKLKYVYRFLWLGENDRPTDSPFPRRTSSETSRLGDYDVQPPAELPLIESHVRPFFVIVDTGRKLSKMANPSKFGCSAQRVLKIYGHWYSPTPEHPRTIVVDRGSEDPQLHIRKLAVGTPPVISDPPLNTQSKDEDDDIDYTPATENFILTWLDCIDAGSYEGTNSADSTDYDHVLHAYRREPAQRAQPRLWQQWAASPPKMPRLLRNDYDTSQLSSYLWSLYHESVNLMAPTGSHRVPLCKR